MAKKVWLKKFLLGIAGGKEKKKLDKASMDCKKTSLNTLLTIMDAAKDTIYGKEKGFSDISSFEDFRSRVPISSYEDFKPYVDRIFQGESDVLFPGKPLLFTSTSGTTKAPKLIPVSSRTFAENYKALSRLWFLSMMRENPRMFDGHTLTVVGKAEEQISPDGLPVGALGGHQYKSIPGLMKDIYNMPYEVYTIDDYASKYYVICRMTAGTNITVGATPNPSTYQQICRVLQERAEDIIEDVEKGTLSKKINISDEQRKIIMEWINPDPKRGKELREIHEKTGDLAPKDIWPDLALLSMWKCGNSGLYIQNFIDKFKPETPIREFAYQASECRTGICMANDEMGTVIMCHMNYFEFIPEEDIELDNPRILGAWEVEKGKRYNVLITTHSGLYRYNMNDLVEIEGFYNEFPKLVFIQKVGGIVSLTGEKLAEDQLIEAVKETEVELNMSTKFYVAFAHFDSSRYHLYVEFENQPPKQEAQKFVTQVDEKLHAINDEYAGKRGSDRLKAMEVHLLQENAFETFKQERIKQGSRDGQFKIVHLMINDDQKAMFDHLVLQ